MMQPSLSFLSLTIRDARDCLESFRNFDKLPEQLIDGVTCLVETLMNCFPDAQHEYHRLMDLDTRRPRHLQNFNHTAEALRLLSPAVDAATYPLHTKYGIMLEDTRLFMALDPGNAMALLGECSPSKINSALWDTEFDTLFDLTERLLEGHPALKASIEQRIDAREPGIDYIVEAYEGIVEAGMAKRPELELAA